VTEHEAVYDYAISALDPDEARRFEAHLAGCEVCRQELASMREVAAELSWAVAAAPPPKLRAAVAEAIRHVPQDAPQVEPRATPLMLQPATDGSTAAPTRLSPARKASLPALLAAAAVVAALALGGWAWSERQAAQQTAQQATARAAELTRLLSAPDATMVTSHIRNGGTTGRVVMSASEQQAVFVAAGLPQLPPGKVYEAWAITGKPVPAGVFSAQEARAAVQLPPETVRAHVMAITIEPAGGSKAPTSSPIFSVKLPRPA
jgi:anti-sigma factor RsiW